jgi:hypothetical protein
MVKSSNVNAVALQPQRTPQSAARRGDVEPVRGEARYGAVNHAVLQLQRAAGNRSVETLLRRTEAQSIHRAPGSALAVVQRAVGSGGSAARIQRQPPGQQDPNIGPYVPPLPTPPMINFGGTLGPDFTPGSPYIKGQGIPGLGSTPNIPLDPTQIPSQIKGLLPKSPGGPPPGGPIGPGACAPGAYNKLWQKCCPDGQQADSSGMNCVAPPDPSSPALPTPDPAPPAQPGDFPTPDPNANTAVA